jgi:hypothetical protein
MVLRDVDRLEGIVNSETNRTNKKKHITECAKLQGERWGVMQCGIRSAECGVETRGPNGERGQGQCSVEFGMWSAEWKQEAQW